MSNFPEDDERFYRASEVVKVTAELHMPTNEALFTAIIDNLIHSGHSLTPAIMKIIDREISVHIKATIHDTIMQRLSETLNKIIDVGWTQTDNYGNPKGSPVTLRKLIIDHMTETTEQYGRGPTNIDKLVAAQVREFFAGTFKAETDAAMAKYRTALDEGLTKRLRDALKL